MPRLPAAMAVLLLAAAPVATAAPPARHDITLSLSVTRDLADFRYADGETVDTRYTRVAAELWSTELAWLQVGLTGGVGWLSQDGDPVTEGRSFDGESLGLLLRTELPVTGSVGVVADGHWIYHDLSDEDDSGRRVDLEWYDSAGRLGVYADLGRLRLEGGGTAARVDGERRRRGETRDFALAEETGAYLRAILATDATGEISATARTGAHEGVAVRFTRRF